MLFEAPPIDWLCAMLRKPDEIVTARPPALSRRASSLYISRRTFSLTVAEPTFPPPNPEPSFEVNSLHSKCAVDPSADSRALSAAKSSASAIPLAGRWFAVWKRVSAAAVPGPNSPSTATYVCFGLSAAQPATRIWSSLTAAPVEPDRSDEGHE